MILFKKLSAFLLASFLFFACSVSNKNEVNKVAISANSISYAEKSLQEQLDIPEPKGAENKSSWVDYKSAVEALSSEDILGAVYYFDLALNEIYSEQEADSSNLPEDSVYFSEMPTKIMFALENIYPKLIDQANIDQANSMLNDYENFYSFEETPLDSAEKEAFENFLDTINLNNFSLPVVINDRVMQEIHYLTVNARKFTEGSLSRKTLLDSMIYSKLKERGMPADLIYLAFVESGFKLNAYSRAKAAGVWQFIPATGKRYGLPSDFWHDMRRNPEAATDAAIGYLSALYQEFGDWHLAMAAYNCGEGRIRRLVREKKEKDSVETVSYWDLKLPRETMHYVPRILAAAIIGHFPEHYSFKIEKQTAVPFDTVSVQHCIPLDKISGAVNTHVNYIRDLNPELIRFCTPPNLKKYTMKVPSGTRETFLAAYEKMDKSTLVSWQQYKVQKGDNLGYISRQFGLKVSDIQSANNLKNTKLRIGQVLIIPVPNGAKKTSTVAAKKTETKSNPEKNVNSENIPEHVRSYVIRKGDNLSTISRRFGVSSKNIMDWNNLQSNKLMVGQKIYLQNLADKKAKTVDISKADANDTDISGTSYVIKSGDNLWDIAKNHNITVEQLKEWNPGLSKKIYPGTRIKIGE